MGVTMRDPDKPRDIHSYAGFISDPDYQPTPSATLRRWMRHYIQAESGADTQGWSFGQLRRAIMLAMNGSISVQSQGEPTSEQLASWLTAVGRSQDRSAFAALFEHFAPRLKSYMFRLGADSATAEDLAQETMVQVWRKAALYDRTKAVPAAWVFRVARNLRIDRLRKQRFHETDIEETVIPAEDDGASNDRVVDQLDASRLAPLVDALPADQQQVVRLAFFEGLSHSEIEQRLAIPLGTVKSRMRLAFGKLRKGMGDSR